MRKKREKTVDLYQQWLKETNPEWYAALLKARDESELPVAMCAMDDDWMHRKPGELDPYEKWLKENHPKEFAKYKKEHLNAGELNRPYQTRKSKK